jgi:hypothetical protein
LLVFGTLFVNRVWCSQMFALLCGRYVVQSIARARAEGEFAYLDLVYKSKCDDLPLSTSDFDRTENIVHLDVDVRIGNECHFDNKFSREMLIKMPTIKSINIYCYNECCPPQNYDFIQVSHVGLWCQYGFFF